MEIDKTISALNSDLRREILKVLAENTYTVLEILNKLKHKGLDVKYRETVYRALEKLVDAKLVEKMYIKGKGLCYKLSMSRLTIEIRKENIEITE